MTSVSTLTIWNGNDIVSNSAAPDVLKTVMVWVRSNVAVPNPELGRQGPACPFVPPALHFRSVWLVAVDAVLERRESLEELLLRCLDIYEHDAAVVGSARNLRTLIVVLPNLPAGQRAALIDAAHGTLKPTVVEHGLMLGEFYPESLSPGVHNPLFHPLRSPVPLFVFRQMVPGDLVFLNKAADPPNRRARYLRAYLKALDRELPQDLVAQAQRALVSVEAELGQCHQRESEDDDQRRSGPE